MELVCSLEYYSSYNLFSLKCFIDALKGDNELAPCSGASEVSNWKYKARSTAALPSHPKQKLWPQHGMLQEIVFSGGLPSAFDACFRLMYSKLRYMCRGVEASPLYTSVQSHGEKDCINCEKLFDADRAYLRGSSCMKSI